MSMQQKIALQYTESLISNYGNNTSISNECDKNKNSSIDLSEHNTPLGNPQQVYIPSSSSKIAPSHPYKDLAHTNILQKYREPKRDIVLGDNIKSIELVRQRGYSTSIITPTINQDTISNFGEKAGVSNTKEIQDLFIASSSLQSQSVAASTSKTYFSVFHTISSEIEAYINVTLQASPKKDWTVFPVDTEEKTRLVFTILTTAIQVRTKYLDLSEHEKRVKYSTVRSYRAALRHFHIVNSINSPLIQPSQFLSSWFEGLKRSCSHNKSSKVPVTINQVILFLRTVSEDIKALKNDMSYNLALRENIQKSTGISAVSKKSNPQNLANVRRAAAIVCGFFGVRRNSETLHLQTHDFSDKKSYYAIKVTFAKNDQYGSGHTTIVPHIPSLEEISPYNIIKAWLIIRKGFLQQLESKKLHQFVFVNIDGNSKSIGNIVSNDTFVKDIKKSIAKVDKDYNSSTNLSLRSGGAQFYTNTDPNKRHLARFLGGWKVSPDQLDQTYAPIQADQVASQIISLSIKGIKLWILETELINIHNNTFGLSKTDIKNISFERVAKFLVVADYNQVYKHTPLIFDHVKELESKDSRFTPIRQWWESVSKQ